MANWCSNTVEFIGEHSQFEKLNELFKTLIEKERIEGKGQLPDFAMDDSGYLFDIRWEQAILNYETRWCPNTSVIIKIAESLTLNFIHHYAEPGNAVFGQVVYLNGLLTDVRLLPDDTTIYQYNEETGLYDFEGQPYECEEEITEILLQRKMYRSNKP